MAMDVMCRRIVAAVATEVDPAADVPRSGPNQSPPVEHNRWSTWR